MVSRRICSVSSVSFVFNVREQAKRAHMTYYGAKEIAEGFRTVRKNTIQVAEDIPEEKYSYRAAPDTMSVGEMLAHLATSTHWADLCHFVEKKSNVVMEDFGRWMGEGGAKAKALTSKTQILQALKA